MSEKLLKHCPFCGGTATVSETMDTGRWWVSCDECSCILTESFDTEDKAIEAWNGRKDCND